MARSHSLNKRTTASILHVAGLALLFSAGVPALTGDAAQTNATQKNATQAATIAPAPTKPPANAAEAKQRLGELIAEEYRFKAATAQSVLEVAPDLDSRTLERLVDYLWLISLNNERCTKASEALKTLKPDEKRERFPDGGPLDHWDYKRLLDDFHNNVIVRRAWDNDSDSDSDTDKSGEKQWLDAYERKAMEREISPFMDLFLSNRHGRDEVAYDSVELARVLWPHHRDKATLDAAFALRSAGKGDSEIARIITELKTKKNTDIPLALAGYAQAQRLSRAHGFVATEAVSLSVRQYLPEYFKQLQAGGSTPIAMAAGDNLGYAPKEGSRPNGLTFKKLTGESLRELARQAGDQRVFLGLSERFGIPNSGNDENYGRVLEGTPFEAALGDRLWVASLAIIPENASDDALNAALMLRGVPVFFAAGGAKQLAAHLAGLSVVEAERELRQRGNGDSLSDLATPWQRFASEDESSKEKPTDAPEKTYRLANPMHALYYGLLLEQASAEQADRILGPVTRVLLPLPGEGWISVERADAKQAGKWSAVPAGEKSAATAPQAAVKPFSLPDAFLAVLSRREVTAMGNFYATGSAAKAVERSPKDARATPDQIRACVDLLGALLDKAGIAGLPIRAYFYESLSQSLMEGGFEKGQALVARLEPILLAADSSVAERIAKARDAIRETERQ